MKLRPSRTGPLSELAAIALSAPVAEIEVIPAYALEQARAFYRAHTDEIITRMRKPTTGTKNVAAVLVALFDRDQRLRAEALRAIETARRAREARVTLDMTLEAYPAPRRT